MTDDLADVHRIEIAGSFCGCPENGEGLSDEAEGESDGGGEVAGVQGAGRVGGTLFHDDGGGAGDEGVAAVWRFGEIRRGSGEREPGVAGAGEVYGLQAAGGRLQLECDGAAEEKVCAGVGGLFCGAADSD